MHLYQASLLLGLEAGKEAFLFYQPAHVFSLLLSVPATVATTREGKWR